MYGRNKDQVRVQYAPKKVEVFGDLVVNNTLVSQRDQEEQDKLDKLLDFLAYYSFHLLPCVVLQNNFKLTIMDMKKGVWDVASRSDIAFVILHLERWADCFTAQMEKVEELKIDMPDDSMKDDESEYLPKYDSNAKGGSEMKKRYWEIMKLTEVIFGENDAPTQYRQKFSEKFNSLRNGALQQQDNDDRERRRAAYNRQSEAASQQRVAEQLNGMEIDFLGLSPHWI